MDNDKRVVVGVMGTLVTGLISIGMDVESAVALAAIITVVVLDWINPRFAN